LLKRNQESFKLQHVTRSLVVCVCFVDRCLSFCTFFIWPLCFLFFFDIRILIAPLVSSNSSSWNPLKIGCELRCSGRVSSFCSTSDTSGIRYGRWADDIYLCKVKAFSTRHNCLNIDTWFSRWFYCQTLIQKFSFFYCFDWWAA
jgi:hypothetical protein